MMTLFEANELVTPIIKSEIFKNSIKLQGKRDEIKIMFEGFRLKNPFKLVQFEILDDEKENTFRDMIAIYKEESKEAQNVNQKTNT